MKKVLSMLAAVLLMAGLFPLACAAAEEISGPSKPAGYILPIMMSDRETRECFFANGTPVTILEPKADTTGWVHDEEIQKSLGNGFSPKKKPGTGAVISWEEGQETRFVYVSGYSKVFGGSLDASVKADVQMTVRGGNVKKAFPNVSFLFGGGYNGDVDGNVTITLEESQMMYVYGGGYNGSITGDVLIQSSGENWSLDMVGGGLASSKTGDAVADVGGNVTLDLRGMMISYMDSLVCGGLAESVSEYTTQANVGGSVSVYAEGRNVYQVCGGGEAYRVSEGDGTATADVSGNIRLELRDSRVRYYNAEVALLGGVFAGGLGHFGKANVGGDCEVIVANTVFDDEALGVILGGMAEGNSAVANVGGKITGQVFSDANPAHVISGGVIDKDGTAEVRGEIKCTE
ncbi:MAG: hypothetical protein ABTB30_03510 [Clostridia bacterium]